MMKTATDFAAQVKKCEKAIRAAHDANAELLSTTKATMALPLPQTYEDSNSGAGGAAAVALHQVCALPPPRVHGCGGQAFEPWWATQAGRRVVRPGQACRRSRVVIPGRTRSLAAPRHACACE